MSNRRIVLILGGGSIPESVAQNHLEKGSTVIYGHTSPLETLKEKTFLTPYPLDQESYDSHLAVWQGAINRYNRVDEVVLCLDEVHALIKATKIGLYYWRRGYLGSKPRIVFLSLKGNAIIGMYRSQTIKYTLLKARADLVTAHKSANQNLVVDAILGNKGPYDSSKDDISNKYGDTVYVVTDGETRIQSPMVGQVSIGQYHLLGRRLAGALILGHIISTLKIRHSQLAGKMQMSSGELNGFFAKGVVGICAILFINGLLGGWGAIIAGYAGVMAF